MSHFKLVLLRTLYTHKGLLFVPNNAWHIRVKAFLGMRNSIRLSSQATPATIKNAYLIADRNGYTPGRALHRAQLVYANGPATLYYIAGP